MDAKTQGLLRASLTSAGTALTLWGFSDGNNWTPVVGIIMTMLSLGWGVWWHRDPLKPGTVKWSLVRKLVNVIGTAGVTYGFMNPQKVAGLEMLVAAMGPLLAMAFTWISNQDDEPPNGPNGFGFLFLAFACLALTSCAGGPQVSLVLPWGSLAYLSDGSVAVAPRAFVIPNFSAK